MKILVLNSNAIFEKKDGAYIHKSTGKFLLDLIKSGYFPEVFHFYLKNSKSDFIAGFNLVDHNIKIAGINRKKSKLFSYLKAYSYGFYRILKNDFLYIFYPNSFFPLCLSAILIGKPYGVYVRGEKGLNSRVSKIIFKKAKFVATVSPVFTSEINSVKAKAFTISPMMNFDIKDINYNRKYAKKSFYRFLFVGRVEIDKGIFELIDAINKIVIGNSLNFVLDVVGDGPHFEEAKEQIDNLKLQPYIKLQGSVYDKERLKKFYQEADVFVLPTYHEGFPRVLYEAMIFGTPIITTFVGTIPYVMKDKENCYEIKPQNSEEIQNYLESFLDNYTEMSSVAKNGTSTISNYLKKQHLTHIEIFNENV